MIFKTATELLRAFFLILLKGVTKKLEKVIIIILRYFMRRRFTLKIGMIVRLAVEEILSCDRSLPLQLAAKVIFWMSILHLWRS